MQWHFSGPRPVYQQIMTQIRSAVLAGSYPPGSRIPPVRELASQARVNPNTMQRALWELEQEGLLVSLGTAGRCVTADAQILEQLRIRAVEETVSACAERFRALGLTMEQAADLLANWKEES